MKRLPRRDSREQGRHKKLSRARRAGLVRQKDDGDNFKMDNSISTKENQAQLLIKLADSADLFNDRDDKGFAIITKNGHREVWPIRSKGFKDWLVHSFYRDQEKP